MKYLILVGIVALGLGAWGGFTYAHHQTCTEIDLYNDYTFKCDGRKIQGPDYAKNYVTHGWEYHSSVN